VDRQERVEDQTAEKTDSAVGAQKKRIPERELDADAKAQAPVGGQNQIGLRSGRNQREEEEDYNDQDPRHHRVLTGRP
jgi:hypothetical protein